MYTDTDVNLNLYWGGGVRWSSWFWHRHSRIRV